MKHTRTINIIIAMLLCISVVFACFGCSSKPESMGKDTPDTNALKDYPEVVEFNKYSVIPELLGTPKELIGSGYVLKSGIEHHYETYLSSDHLDVNYNVGSLDMRYEIDPADMLYIVGVRVRTQDKTIETVNGKRVVTYISDKLVLGMKVGINYKEACRNLESFGYKKLYEQPIITSGVATSREISYGKGIIVISMAVETGGDVSSFNAWIPYDTSKIESIFDNSKVPAKLGLIYNCYGSSETTFTFLKKTQELKADDFSGAFFQAGVAELTMACCCIGMALHGGVIPACGTFFVFSDYMKPAIRMAALMQLPVKFIWSHDAFRVGEDGPTHQPVEQEAQIRLMEKLKNHAGRNSMLVIRPADAQETTVAWQMAMENTHTPTALILSRQNIADLPEGNDYSQAQKGAYVVAGSDEDYEAVLVASGSEVSTLVAGAALLRKEGIHTRIVSVPSEGLFRSQPLEYQHQVVPVGAKVFGLTAGLPVNLQAFLIGAAPESRIWGLESFGFSAPYKVLDEKLGYTAENVYNQVKAMLS